MKVLFRIGAVVTLAGLNFGCAGDSTPSSSVTAGPSPVVVPPANSDLPPPTFSGDVETSVTSQSK
jgi:hypothetical protein